jgi:catechol 2,3-dioxygenase-like lactoylglutathione lyase family enzyme
MKMWNIAGKVSDLEKEIAFVTATGGHVLLDNIIHIEGRDFRVVLMKWGDKYLHLFEKAVYEHHLESPLGHGLCHVVFEVPNLAAARQRALDAGARELMPPAYVSSGFGTRDVAFLQSPGGILFEFAEIHEHKVPVLP